MKPGKLTNQELDKLGRSVLRAGAANENEIDRIVSNPGLFNDVLLKIVEDAEAGRSKARFAWMPILAASAIAVIFTVPLVSYLNSVPILKNRVPPVDLTVTEEAKPFRNEVPLVKQADPDQPRPVHAVLSKPVEKPAEAKVRNTRPKRHEVPEAAFHSIGPPTNAEDAVLDGRVVRVEMPRSALFAMGVDLPLENGTRAVKADLLVGSDGIPRGIRLVE